MPRGGTITVLSENTNLDVVHAEKLGLAPGRYVKITFTDTGTGIDPSILDKIFDPFFTTKQKSRGTGLGLASAFGIISNHSGMIDVSSRKGRGTTFTIHLPATLDQPVEVGSLSDDVITGNGLALLVDDEQMIVDVGQSMLEEIGFEVLVAENGEQAKY